MITRENIKQVIENLHPAEIEGALISDGDYVLIRLHVFNVDSYTTIQSMDYSEDTDEWAAKTGNLFIDKSSLLNLLQELDIEIYKA